jgi:cytochrome c
MIKKARTALAAGFFLMGLLCACAMEQGQPAASPVASAPEPSIPMAADLASDGRDMAEAQCAGCHAVGPFGASPNPASPPFRTILSRYNAHMLEANLIDGIQVAHPMPEFQFNPKGVDALLAYLQSIQETPPKSK